MATTTEETKTCPVCKKSFTRKQLGISIQQWGIRIYCSRKCYFKTSIWKKP